jgi:hypothetical protein
LNLELVKKDSSFCIEGTAETSPGDLRVSSELVRRLLWLDNRLRQEMSRRGDARVGA